MYFEDVESVTAAPTCDIAENMGTDEPLESPMATLATEERSATRMDLQLTVTTSTETEH